MITDYVTTDGTMFRVQGLDDKQAQLFECVDGEWIELAYAPLSFIVNVHLPAEINSRKLTLDIS